jgi:catechol 2,3-dioxygenase-like lactoylglutathione lyase family enzyme
LRESQREQCQSTIIGIHHIGMSVSDLKASLDFYTQGLGTSAERLTPAQHDNEVSAYGASARSALLSFPNGYLKLSEYDRTHLPLATVLPVKGPGITHVCYQSPTQENIYQRLMDSGATPVSRGTEPVHLLGQGVYYAYARDRDGIMYETEHLDRSPFEGPIWFSHVALVSPDLDRLVEFYGLLLNAEPNRRTNRASGPTFDEVADYDDVMIRAAWFDVGNMILEMWQFVNPVTPEPKQPPAFEALGYNKMAFEVSDLDREVERLSEQGIEFLAPLGVTEEGLEACLRDPDGNLVSLIQPQEGTGRSVAQLKQKTW